MAPISKPMAPTNIDNRLWLGLAYGRPPVYRGTSLRRTPPPPEDHRRAIGIGLLQGPMEERFLMSEVPLYFSTTFMAPRKVVWARHPGHRLRITRFFRLFSFFMTLGLELGDTKVYEPCTRALLGTASRYCEVVVLQLRTVPSSTALASFDYCERTADTLYQGVYAR